MRRGFKYSVTLLSLLACLSLFAIGFASWTILLGIEVEASIEGNIGSEDVIYSNDYVSYEIDSSRMFKYCRYGFVKDDEIVNEGTLPLSIELKNLASFKDRYIDLEYEWFYVALILLRLKFHQEFPNQTLLLRFDKRIVILNTILKTTLDTQK